MPKISSAKPRNLPPILPVEVFLGRLSIPVPELKLGAIHAEAKPGFKPVEGQALTGF